MGIETLLLRGFGESLALAVWPLTSCYLVAATWFSPSSPRLMGDRGLRSGLKRLILGGDTRSLQVCIIAFVVRAMWGWFAELLRAMSFTLISPYLGVLFQTILILSVAPCKERVHSAGREQRWQRQPPSTARSYNG